MNPKKSLDLLIDDVIEQTIDLWIEEKHREPEQMELIEEEA